MYKVTGTYDDVIQFSFTQQKGAPLVEILYL